MSDFRLFCITYFMSHGLLAFAFNRDLLPTPEIDKIETLMALSFWLGTAVVALFGQSEREAPKAQGPNT